MDLFIARIIDGLNTGAIYAFIAIALVIVFKGAGHLNIAQGNMAMITAYLALEATQVGAPVWLACIVAVVLGLLMGAGVERGLIRPLGPHAEGQALIVTIGLLLVLEGVAATIWDVDPLAFPTIVPSGGEHHVVILGTRVQNQQLLIMGMLAVVVVVLYGFFNKTKLGLAMRTAAESPESATLLGIRVGLVQALGWAIAGAVGSLAAVLIAPSITLTPGMMFGFLIYGIAAALLGGFDSTGGALVAGLFLGVAESLVAGYVEFIGQDLKQAFALFVILAVLLARPSGLFGSARVERV